MAENTGGKSLKHKLMLVAILILAFALRFGHLSLGQHYTIVNPDSFWFHILSKKDDVSWYQTGLAPILNLTGGIGALLIPPLIGVATTMLVYYIATKVFNQKIGLWSAALFAVFQPAAIMSLAGNLDRDALTLFLVTLAMTIYYFSRNWKGGLLIAAIMLVIFLEWSWIGAVVVGGIITVSAIIEYWQTKHIQRPQVLGVLAICAAVVVPFLMTAMWSRLGWILNNDEYHVNEMTPLTIITLWPYWTFLLFPLAYAVLWAYRGRKEHEPLSPHAVDTPHDGEIHGKLFFFSWMIACLLMGLVAYRLAQFMIPAACILGAVGLFYAMEMNMAKDRKQTIAIFSIGMLCLSAFYSVKLPSNFVMPNDWVDATTYIKEQTSENDRFITWWDNGYWIEDLGERDALVDGSHVRSDLNKDVAMIYTTESDSYAAAIMAQHDVDYLVFSDLEDKYFPVIESKADRSGDNGLYRRSQSQAFQSDLFEVVYRNDTVWIIGRRCTTCENS